jgi:hypothetical protein
MDIFFTPSIHRDQTRHMNMVLSRVNLSVNAVSVGFGTIICAILLIILSANQHSQTMRTSMHSLSTITLEAASLWFEDEDTLIGDIERPIKRSIPDPPLLQKNPHLVDLLRLAVVECGIVCEEVSDHKGLNDALRQGYLHASVKDLEGTLCAFPSSFNER